ncbi:unknown [Roseburia sp. CAG:182]|nr:unknown [Roseburia sp. CAG:182]
MSKEAIKSLGAGMEYYSIRYGDKEKETAFRTEIYEKYGTVEYVEQKANTRISLIY